MHTNKIAAQFMQKSSAPAGGGGFRNRQPEKSLQQNKKVADNVGAVRFVE